MNRYKLSWLLVVLWLFGSLWLPRASTGLVADAASSTELVKDVRASASAVVPDALLSPPVPASVGTPASATLPDASSQAKKSGETKKVTSGHGSAGGWWEALGLILISDAVMSVENVLIIAILVSAVPQRIRVVATFFGLLAAGVFRVIFASLASILMKFPVVALLGALALMFLTISIFTDTVRQVRKKQAGEDHPVEEKMDFGQIWHELQRVFGEKGFWKTHEGEALKTVTVTVILQDILLSLDNVLVVAGNAVGDISLTVIGVGASILMMATMANLMVSVVQKYPVVGLIGGLALAKASYNLFRESYDPETAVVAFGTILIFLMLARVYKKLTTDEEEEVEPLRFDEAELAETPAPGEAAPGVTPVAVPAPAAVAIAETAPVVVGLTPEFLRELMGTIQRHNETLERVAVVLQKIEKTK